MVTVCVMKELIRWLASENDLTIYATFVGKFRHQSNFSLTSIKFLTSEKQMACGIRDL